MPFTQCLETVAAQSRSKRTRRMLLKVAEDVGAGRTIARSFETNAPYLPRTFIETVRAGEQSGTLEMCFRRLHAYYDRMAKTKSRIISTLTYPAVVMVAAIVVFLIIMVVAVPAFAGAFEGMGAEIPAVTRAVMAISDFTVNRWWVVLIIAAAAWGGLLLFRKSASGRVFFSAVALKYAPFHGLRTMSAAARFASTLSTMLAAGLSLPKALEVTEQISGNYIFAMGVSEVRQNVERGYGIAESMTKVECFPKILTEMIGVGEQSGTLEKTLEVIADYFEHEVEAAATRLTAVLEPLITIALAVMVAGLLMAVYLPMFSLYGTF